MNKSSKGLKGEKEESQKQELEITVHRDMIKGVYSNLAIIRHTPNEFIIDFLFQLEGRAELISRVIMSPEQMVLFKGAVEINLKLFEDKKNKH
ncbi:MAG: DUF3467 domain-containing protein [Proteobacteria bacterium]|nr:DUF3467 domain-containing protein [Pseudomonadota bacterium]MBU4353909.1 DUF3467 domain-containing protein [Pseudomonadota bacterium]MBU4448375.1 DUF3467 domain-containing protein [Pseudomonadota bacterium]MCG2771765.1 DUF3467 domain-containing protein [Desulfobacterales bacterium]